ncbi:lytic transglycosylase domain-containing protein [Bacillota bacterium Meth-B3]
MDKMALNGARRRRPRRRRRRAGGLLLAVLVIALVGAAWYYVGLFPGWMEQKIYPLEYEEMIDRYAGEYALEPARVLAVIYCESSFRPDAVSSAGAIGLMQIMPETGAWIAQKLNEPGYEQGRLFDPETNIRYGCWYLNYLDGRFDGDLTKATAAYHAGGGKVDQWLSDDAYSPDGQTLENIPFKATSAYVRHVRQVYEKYKEITEA